MNCRFIIYEVEEKQQAAEFVTEYSEKFDKCERLQEEALPQFFFNSFATGLQEFKKSTGHLSD
jgi:hypothetical protein